MGHLSILACLVAHLVKFTQPLCPGMGIFLRQIREALAPPYAYACVYLPQSTTWPALLISQFHDHNLVNQYHSVQLSKHSFDDAGMQVSLLCLY